MRNVFIIVLIFASLISCKNEKNVPNENEKISKTKVVKKENLKALLTFVNYENIDGSKTSLIDLKGKYVYIDVWATWCGPCRKQIPYLQKLEEEYHGKNIAFVSISLDEDKDKAKWKNMITDKKMGGIQLIADKNWESDFAKAFRINSIPRFIFIDPKGNIIDSNAPRPSSKNDINKLFSEI